MCLSKFWLLFFLGIYSIRRFGVWAWFKMSNNKL